VGADGTFSIHILSKIFRRDIIRRHTFARLQRDVI
jgi:hypothetical protein